MDDIPKISLKLKAGKLRIRMRFSDGSEKLVPGVSLDDSAKNRKMIKEQVIPEYRRRLMSGEYRPLDKKKMFGEYCTEFLKRKEGKKTYYEIESRMEKACVFFKEKTPIDKITPLQCENFILELKDRYGKPVGPKTMRNYLHNLKGIFDLAMKARDIKEHPCLQEYMELPEMVKESPVPFRKREFILVLEALKGLGCWRYNFVGLMGNLGFRPGEGMAILKSDINLDKREIALTHSIRAGKRQSPKTHFSVRTIPILDGAMPFLMDQLERSGQSLYLFPGNSGGHMYGPEVIDYELWRKVLNQCSLTYRVPYNVRHTFALHMLDSIFKHESGMKLSELAEMMGHANTEMLLKVYAKIIEGEVLKVDRGINIYDMNSVNSETIQKFPKTS